MRTTRDASLFSAGDRSPHPPGRALASPGYVYEAVEQNGWELIAPDDPMRGRRCRFRGCAADAEVILYRPAHYESGVRMIPWRYCSEHMYGRYGRWIADGKVLGWRLVKDDASRPVAEFGAMGMLPPLPEGQ